MCPQALQRVWLAKAPFLAGEHITIADLQVSAELEGMRVVYGSDLVGSAASLTAAVEASRATEAEWGRAGRLTDLLTLPRCPGMDATSGQPPRQRAWGCQQDPGQGRCQASAAAAAAAVQAVRLPGAPVSCDAMYHGDTRELGCLASLLCTVCALVLCLASGVQDSLTLQHCRHSG